MSEADEEEEKRNDSSCDSLCAQKSSDGVTIYEKVSFIHISSDNKKVHIILLT